MKIKVTLIRSYAGKTEKMRKVLQALGLRKIGMTVLHGKNPAINGMLHKVSHLVRVEEAVETTP
ncbi:MAG: 50S ribosomal protein L30 [Candidatus Magnetobacterium sp. LHC-1]|uniref:50S ribosomal protein L30 n=1 Tax=Candidatus Magnetobacterium casense TaxID=1455061 RepID=A0ABS6RVQ7_9BACT|nr:50S ribosomal protein L30 [Candidatus Magnetobacterium casensis]MBF0607812.1 50S ribosomal protein L30 [Nitrospirota bacterium]MBV6340676.1 50S ribosomal protein L30 [Candidatus Magnetobacterium casensis]